MTRLPQRHILTPGKIVNSEGSLYYDEKSGAWGIIRLKAEMVREFYQLKERSAKFLYKMKFLRTIEDLEKSIKELKKNKEALPILLWFEKKR